MKLSVVIPVYDGADFVLKSYESILGQDLKDFELLYVNNNSTDSTEDEIKKLQQKDSRVHYHFQPKQGSAPARNLGIQNADGDYVYFFDIDDEIYPGALHRLMEVLDTNPNIEAVFGKMVKSDKDIKNTEKPIDETNCVILNNPPYWGLYWFSSLLNVVGPPAFLYRKSVFDSIGFYNEDLKIGEDTAFDIKLGMTSTIAFLDRYVYLYFKHEGSTIQASKRRIPRAFMIWPRLVKEHLPFYLEHDTPHRFKELLFSQLYQTMGRQLQYTKGFKQRRQLKQELLNDIKTTHTPIIIKWYLSILVLMPLAFVRKLYGYYLVPRIVKHLMLKNQKR